MERRWRAPSIDHRWCPRCKEWVDDFEVTSYRQVYATTMTGMRFKFKHPSCGKKWYYTYKTGPLD